MSSPFGIRVLDSSQKGTQFIIRMNGSKGLKQDITCSVLSKQKQNLKAREELKRQKLLFPDQIKAQVNEMTYPRPLYRVSEADTPPHSSLVYGSPFHSILLSKTQRSQGEHVRMNHLVHLQMHSEYYSTLLPASESGLLSTYKS